MSNIAVFTEATNLTIQFPRPEGLIDNYSVEYTLLKPPQTDQNQTVSSINWTTSSTLSGNSETSSSGWKNFTDFALTNGASGNVTVNLSLDDLISGAGYALRIRTCSHFMYSDPIHTNAYTSKLIYYKFSDYM